MMCATGFATHTRPLKAQTIESQWHNRKSKKMKTTENTDYTEAKRCFSVSSVLSVVNAFSGHWA